MDQKIEKELIVLKQTLDKVRQYLYLEQQIQNSDIRINMRLSWICSIIYLSSQIQGNIIFRRRGK